MARKKKTRKLSPQAEKLLQQQKEAFRQKLGRDPGPEDPVFFDPSAKVPQPLDADKGEALVIQAMGQAEIDPAYIYAYRKTGLLLTTENRDLLSKEDLAEWQSAIQEYRDKIESNIQEFTSSTGTKRKLRCR